jgi:hypothetical protein
MWEPRPLTTLWAFTACYSDSITFFFTRRFIVSVSNVSLNKLAHPVFFISFPHDATFTCKTATWLNVRVTLYSCNRALFNRKWFNKRFSYRTRNIKWSLFLIVDESLALKCGNYEILISCGMQHSEVGRKPIDVSEKSIALIFRNED